jgi:hypothetical protein
MRDPRARHPAGRNRVHAEVAWSGNHALVTITNRSGHVEQCIVTGPTQGTRRVIVRGSDSLAVVYDVPPMGRLTIERADDGRILYDGTSSEA